MSDKKDFDKKINDILEIVNVDNNCDFIDRIKQIYYSNHTKFQLILCPSPIFDIHDKELIDKDNSDIRYEIIISRKLSNRCVLVSEDFVFIQYGKKQVILLAIPTLNSNNNFERLEQYFFERVY